MHRSIHAIYRIEQKVEQPEDKINNTRYIKTLYGVLRWQIHRKTVKTKDKIRLPKPEIEKGINEP